MNKIGETTVTVYPVVNPDMKRVITVSVTDVGGHDYVISQAEPGSGETEKICSKCGTTKTVTIPTAITRTVWWSDSNGYYKPADVEVGDEINLEVDYAPTKVDNSEFIVTSSDEGIVKVSDPESSYRRYDSAAFPRRRTTAPTSSAPSRARCSCSTPTRSLPSERSSTSRSRGACP